MLEQILRLFRHRWTEDSHRVISSEVMHRLTQRVAASEQKHSGEIRLCIEASLPSSYLVRPDALPALTRQRALSQFAELGVWDTEHNNGVLVYLLLAERAIELVADRGLHRQVPQSVWTTLVQRLETALHDNRFEDGLTQAIDELSDLLTAYFPLTPGQVNANELADGPVLR